jgi:hypothetical protein
MLGVAIRGHQDVNGALECRFVKALCEECRDGDM